MSHQTKYRFFEDSAHCWLEVPRSEVKASNADISEYSYYDPKTDMAYLEEDCDMWAFFRAAGKSPVCIGKTVQSTKVRQLLHYDSKIQA